DMVGSTKEIIEYAKENVNDEIIFVTERGVCEYMQMLYPNRSFYQLVPDILTCPNMKKTTLTGVLNALKGTGGKIIELDEDARLNALSSIEKMLNYGG
ncbi:MAG: quinolinate synthase NadA, partial [Erysipelotrichaceae bacterium]